MSRLVIGLGFREQATAQSIGEVLARAVEQAAMPEAATMLAVVEDKTGHPGLCAAVAASRYPIRTVAAEAMRDTDTSVTTRSERVIRQRGVGSVCEATALAAAGPNGRLVVTRMVSADHTATAAAAVTEDSAS